MPITFACPQCGRTFRAPESLAGKTGKCKMCGGAIAIPAPGSAGAPPNPHGRDGAHEPTAQGTMPEAATPGPTAGGRRHAPGPLTLAGLGSIVALVGAALAFSLGRSPVGDREAVPAGPAPPVGPGPKEPTSPAPPQPPDDSRQTRPPAASPARPAAADNEPPIAGRGAGTVPIWNPHRPAPGNRPVTVRVLVLNYDPIVPFERHRRLTEVFGWNNPAELAMRYKEAMEYASGGYLRFEVVEWRNLNQIYAKEDGYRYTVEEYVRNRRSNSGWGEHGNVDYPRLLREQNVVPLVDDGRVDEVWVFSDHFFGLWEASMAGPGAFFINGGVYPEVPSRRPFTIYGFNYERGVAEMMHDASHRTEATLNRVYGAWDLKAPKNHWEKFSANHSQSGGQAGVGTCHWPANAEHDYDYGNTRVVPSWADAFLTYPRLELVTKPVSRATWSRGPDYHLDYMKWYFAHLPRGAGVNPDGRQNNWMKYVFDFQSYDAQGRPLAASAELHARDVAAPEATAHTIRVAYRSAELIDPGTLGDADPVVTGPDGRPLAVELTGGAEPGSRSYRVARYQVRAPGESWVKSPAGSYTVELRAGEVRDLDGNPLPGGRLGGFQVRGEGKPTPLTADADTLWLASFEDREAAVGRGPSSPRQEPGVVGRGAYLGRDAALRMPAEGRIAPEAGTVEFWLRPSWPGSGRTGHTFFTAGRPFDNGLLILIDGANNVRMLVWGDNPETPEVERNYERGVGTPGAGWKANEWHHIAATWDGPSRALALYIDGTRVSEEGRGPILPQFGGGELWVGSGVGGAEPAEAVLDELRISRRARTGDEVRADYEAGLDGGSLIVQVPAGELAAYARERVGAVSRSAAGVERELTRDVAWSSSKPEVASVDGDGTLRSGLPGEATITARLGGRMASAVVTVQDPGYPRASLSRVEPITKPGQGPASFVVTYDSAAGIAAESLGLGDVRVIGPNGFQQFAQLRSTSPGRSPRSLMVTYFVEPPAGRWSEADRGRYTVEIKGFQVADARGLHVPEGVLGSLPVLEPSRP